MTFQEYVEDINMRYATGTAREHTYRTSLHNLLEDVIPNIIASNDPARISCGAPDYILSRRNIDVGYIEAKDIGDNLDETEKSEQLKRYRKSLDNLILTDYMEFRFFMNSDKVETIRLCEIQRNTIKPLPENFARMKTLLIDFAAFQGQTIKSAKKLAEMMAQKARLMRDVFFKAVKEDSENNTLNKQLMAFKKVLVHDMDEAQFADVYAQTIAYGLFTARLHDTSLEDFSRTEALTLIPKSNPFLRQLFHYVAGPDLDDRVVWIVDALCEVYRSTDLREILHDFGSATGQSDPILHFYETFLAEYDPKLRKSRGVFYTPEPVVNFIVRAIDDVLKEHFGLKDGLADTTKIKIEVEAQESDKRTKTGRKMVEKEVHKVQLLDVATGTGTFLAEVIKQVYSRFKGQEGLWSTYVENDLLPRLHGFELLMASYAMCHMKLDLLLQETGYKPSNPQNPPRVSVYLTNSLEEYHPDMDTLFASWLSREANEASRIKKDMPIMVAFGNPPYSGISQNMGNWIVDKIEDYKYVEGKHFGEKKHWLHDDYVKFIRLGEYYIEKNGEGILAYISNNGYLDNPTFRGMRWHLRNTFDDIYILNLHGNAKKKEIAPNGEPDKNVFDIQQGVSIIVAVKQPDPNKKSLANIHYLDVWGTRKQKYDLLVNYEIKSNSFKKIDSNEPYYFFVPEDRRFYKEYSNGFALDDLFRVYVTGIVTARDNFVIDIEKDALGYKIEKFCDKNLDTKSFQAQFKLNENYQWKVKEQRNLIPEFDEELIRQIMYRPFDNRHIYYQSNLVFRMREKTMRHFLLGKNVGLVLSKRVEIGQYSHVFLTSQMIQHHSMSLKEVNIVFPLWLYDEGMKGMELKDPNLNESIYIELQKAVPDINPINVFDYIYSILHSSAYRQRYAEFLKSDFPRIPYPTDGETFHALAKHGAELRELHLLDSDKFNDFITTYPIDGDHEVKKPRYEDGKVWINEFQYFGNVPEVAWNFYIGGYQPAQKWLKDRKGRKLTVEDIIHWQHIIVALTETDKIMKQIDKIDFLPK